LGGCGIAGTSIDGSGAGFGAEVFVSGHIRRATAAAIMSKKIT
jgi:hypothetical protein